GIFTFIDAHFFQLVIRGQCRISCLHFGVQILQPLRLGTAFGKIEIYSSKLAHIASTWELAEGDVISPLPIYTPTFEGWDDPK
ncbi:hypothetical protein ONJ16_27785, partial [Salmonella enterica subsp. enterica serovar Montevideo]|nr:hypothetical protein [Salmonella enterica subsp. enterica serovar Montevideo]